MTSIEVPYSIAAALPSLSVMDITNDVSREVAGADVSSGIAYPPPASTLSLVRVQERETGFFEDLESLLERVVPGKLRSRERLARVPARPALGAGAVRRRRPLPRPVAADPPLLARRAAPSRLDAHAARLTARCGRGS